MSLSKEAEPVKKAKRVKRPAKKSTTAPTAAGVVIRDTPGVSVSKKKAPAKADRSKGDGTDFESGVPDEQQRKTSGTDEGTSTKPGVPDVPKYQSESDDESWGDSEDDNDDFNDEDEDDDNDVDVRSLGVEHEEEKKCDEDMTDADQNISQEHSYEQVIEDVHVTLTASQRTDDSKQSSSVSSDFANQLLILEKAPPSDHEVSSLMNIKMSHKVPSTQISTSLTEPTTVIADSFTIASTIVPPTISNDHSLDKDLFDSYGKAYSLKRSSEDKDKDEDPPAGPDQGLNKKKTSKDDEPSRGSKSKESKSSSSKGSKSQSKSSGKSAQEEEPMFETADIKMPQDQGDDMGNTEDQPNNATKSIDSRPPQQWINIIAQAEKPPLTFDELMSTPIDFLAYVMHNLKIDNLTKEILIGPAFNLLKGTCKSFVELEYHFEECYKVVTDQLNWNNPEGHEYPFDLSKPLSLIESQGRQVVPVDYFFNNDFEYLKGGSSSRKYTTSTTKTKAAK
ncbi:hypothetical protein Tco_0433056 [Tanacetum coccineum]